VAENEKQQRPVRKLTVKNFSVIKDATLDFGKITVLIGPQASGKSLLCKLAYFLRYEVIRIAIDSISSGTPWEEFENQLNSEFMNYFPSQGWVLGRFTASIQFEEYFCSFEGEMYQKIGSSRPTFHCSDTFKEVYCTFLDKPIAANFGDPGFTPLTVLTSFLDLQGVENRTLGVYIPAGRAFYTNADLGFALLQNTNLDALTRRFATQIVWNPVRWKAGLAVPERNVPESLEQYMGKIVDGSVVIEDNTPIFKHKDGRKLALNYLSSGTQEMLPLFNVLNRQVFEYESAFTFKNSDRFRTIGNKPHTALIKPVLFLEEPETHIFPSTQAEIVRLFAWLAGDSILSFDWVITTHSPYILTAFNDLIKAGQIAAEQPDKVADVEKIVPRQYWIKPGDFAAYAFDGKDGKLRSIMDEETKLIDGDVLDDISSTIGSEFEQLLEIQYGGK
jgi:hypothetical protein